MNTKTVPSTNNQAGGLRAVCPTPEGSPASLPDLCHHALYEIYVNGQYVESVGNLGANAQRAREFYQRKRRGRAVEIRVLHCRLQGCTWRSL